MRSIRRFLRCVGFFLIGAMPAALAFELTPDPAPTSVEKRRSVDMNIGATPEAFVSLLWRQLTGQTLPPAAVAENSAKLGTAQAPRRIDLALQLAQAADITPPWSYSDPWQQQIPLKDAAAKTVYRDVGAVFLFFFTSPGPPNGGPAWANNHSPGMFASSPWLAFDGQEHDNPHNGFYHPKNAGFWYREMQDAKAAGLSFLLPNVYGPDLDADTSKALLRALERLSQENGDDVIKLGLFDDTWTWGQPWFGPEWQTKPDCLDVERTARLLYESKWRKFFQLVPRKHWFLVQGRPMVYFYNANTLQHPHAFSPVLARMKALFAADFGVQPWVAVDSAFDNAAGIEKTADHRFQWYSSPQEKEFSRSQRGGITLAHAMVRWDSIARSHNRTERRATAHDVLVKGDAKLRHVLNSTRDADLLVIATWNDLGEGTGINRTYDYYDQGKWLRPDHFLQLIQRSQAGDTL